MVIEGIIGNCELPYSFKVLFYLKNCGDSLHAMWGHIEHWENSENCNVDILSLLNFLMFGSIWVEK